MFRLPRLRYDKESVSQIVFCAIALTSASWLIHPFLLRDYRMPVSQPPSTKPVVNAPLPSSTPASPAQSKPEQVRPTEATKPAEAAQSARPMEVER